MYFKNCDVFMKMNRILYQLVFNKTCQIVTVATSLLLVIQSTPIQAQVETPETVETRETETLPTQTAPTTNTSTGTTPNFSGVESDYTLGSGDQIRLDIFQVEEYSGDYPVLVDGTISLPLVGNLNVDGLTLKEASNLVSKQYSTYLKRPIVTVGLVAPRPLKIGISGEVDNAGSYEITLDSASPNFPTVTDMLEKAGGITTLANVRTVRVTRTVQGKEVSYNSDLWALVTEGRLSQDLSLRDGDTIFIPTVEEIDPGELVRLSETSFGLQTDKPIKVAVVGEIYRPGSHTVKPEKLGGANGSTDAAQQEDSLPPSLSQAIQAAGGIKPLANVKEIEVRRRTWDGQEKVLAVDLWELIKSGDIGKDVILQDGDRVIVPKATALAVEDSRINSTLESQITVNVVGEVAKPGAQTVDPNTPLNQAILAAGGFNSQRANKGAVELVRLNADGTVEKRKIEVDLAQGIDEETNPILRHQDVVVVSRSGLTSAADGAGKVLSPVGGALGIIRLFFGF
jgi:polysaccharide biosynthesis/export protein